MNRRDFLLSGAAALGVVGAAATMLRMGAPQPALAAEKFEITKTDDEWKAILSPAAFDVLRKQGTEYPGTSPLLNEHRKGIFACAGCDLPVYPSETKFDRKRKTPGLAARSFLRGQSFRAWTGGASRNRCPRLCFCLDAIPVGKPVHTFPGIA